MEFLIVWVACAGLTAAIASSKGRSGKLWLGLGLLLGCFGLFMAIVIRRRYVPSAPPAPVVQGPYATPTATVPVSSAPRSFAPPSIPAPSPAEARPPAQAKPMSGGAAPKNTQEQAPDATVAGPPDLSGPPRFVSRGTGAFNPTTYDAAVALVYPVLHAGGRPPRSSVEALAEIAAAAEYLAACPANVRGVGFESFRSLSIAANRAMASDPRDSFMARALYRGLAGKGDDDISVESYITSECSTLARAARVALLDMVFSDSRPYDRTPAFRHQVSHLVLVHTLGARPPSSAVTEEYFSAQFYNFQYSLHTTLKDPQAVLNMMLSVAPPPIKDHQRLLRRFANGKYTPEALHAMRHFLNQYRPAVQQVARYQRFMGWAPTTWDPLHLMSTP